MKQQLKQVTPVVTDYCCPLCDSQMVMMNGDTMNPTNGVSLWCPNLKCPAQEVSGHAKNVKLAYDIVRMKFTAAKVEMEVDE